MFAIFLSSVDRFWRTGLVLCLMQLAIQLNPAYIVINSGCGSPTRFNEF